MERMRVEIMEMVDLSVCIGSVCHLSGAYNVVQSFTHMIEEYNLHDKIDFHADFCMRNCSRPGVSVSLNGTKYTITADEARNFFREKVLPVCKAVK